MPLSRNCTPSNISDLDTLDLCKFCEIEQNDQIYCYTLYSRWVVEQDKYCIIIWYSRDNGKLSTKDWNLFWNSEDFVAKNWPATKSDNCIREKWHPSCAILHFQCANICCRCWFCWNEIESRWVRDCHGNVLLLKNSDFCSVSCLNGIFMDIFWNISGNIVNWPEHTI